MNAMPDTSSLRPRRPRPLSYEDLRRFLFLVVALGLAFLMIRSLADVLTLFTVVIFLAMVLNPVVVWLEKRGIRRGMAVMIVLFGMIGSFIGMLYLVAPPLVEQVSSLVSKAPTYSENIETQLKRLLERFPQVEAVLPEEYKADNLNHLGETWTKTVGPQLIELLKTRGPNFGSQVLTLGVSVVGGIFTSVIALMMLAFALSNPWPLMVGFLSIVPERHRETAGRSVARIENQMVAWMRATLINGVITGISTTILLYFVGLPSVIVFGVLSFFGEFVPNIGPLGAALPALFVGAGMGTAKFLWTGAAILFVQTIESNLLVPIVMGREMELHPLTIVFFALGMGSILGIAGAILAVPMAAIAKVLVDEFIIKANAVPIGELESRAKILLQQREWPGAEATDQA
ncbi:AI-2E family transporter [bacterium]|nr:MAG: AI-2E family transporter [bacterium]